LRQKYRTQLKKILKLWGYRNWIDPERFIFLPRSQVAPRSFWDLSVKTKVEIISGYFGLEGYYDLPLSGKPGFFGSQKNALGAPILSKWFD